MNPSNRRQTLEPVVLELWEVGTGDASRPCKQVLLLALTTTILEL